MRRTKDENKTTHYRWSEVDSLDLRITERTFYRWVENRVKSVTKHAKKKGDSNLLPREDVRKQVVDAVIVAKGKDRYTGDNLDWSQVGKHVNVPNNKRMSYPSVDHLKSGSSSDFVLCSMAVNDSKSDLDLDEWLSLCQIIVGRSKEIKKNHEAS